MNNYIEDAVDEKIKKINNQDNVYEVGKVTRVGDYILEVSGLENVAFFEKVNIANKGIGYVNNILKNSVIIAVLKEEEPINVGDKVYSTNEEYKFDFSVNSLGRIIDIFGEDKISGKKFEDLINLKIENKNTPIMDRSKVERPLLTGIAGIDLIYPIGKGQRQLIIGDKKTGKTQICLDTIVNQADAGVVCIYVAIGKTKKEVKEIYFELLKRGAMKYTIILATFNDERPTVLSLTPYVGLSIAEAFMKLNYDVLVVLDDLKRHAEAYREISIVSGKNPGRDAYPADIFYTHSRLLEKGCQHKSGSSITILPVMETSGGDITDYISTNIISITDGQIVLSDKNYQKGIKPAINYGLSVSRLGGAVQSKQMKELGALTRQKLLSYLETKDVYELANTDEMSSELQQKMLSGKKIMDNLIQYKYSPLSVDEILEKFSFVSKEN